MLQRIQSVWLFLAAAFDAATFKLPFYTGDWSKDATPAVVDLNALTAPWFTVLAALAGLIALVTIFLFRNRKLQLKLCYAGIFITLAMLALYAVEVMNFIRGSVALWVIFYAAILVFYMLSVRGIRADQKLIKSLDRLR